MRLFTAGLVTETNSFSSVPTTSEDFTVTRHSTESGTSQEPTWAALVPFGQWQYQAEQYGDEILFGMYAMAEPSGLTERQCYESLRDELLAALASVGKVDVVLLALHGAMMAEGYEDCEGDLIARARACVGPDVIVAVELDLHCHLTSQMMSQADVIVTLKEYPHTDVNARGEELYDLARLAAAKQIRPVMAVFDCKLVGSYPTTTPVMRDFIAKMVAAEQGDGLLSVSFIHGFPYGDSPEGGGKLLVVADNDIALAQREAEHLSQQLVALRRQISFDTVPLDEALSRVLVVTNHDRPLVIADQSDNPGGGAPGDATFALRWLLDHKAQAVAMAIVYDPEVVTQAQSAGVGAALTIRLGGKLGPSSGEPVEVSVRVLAELNHYQHPFPQAQGEPNYFNAGDVVALRCQDIDIVVSSQRCQCFAPSIFTDLGIDLGTKNAVVVKSKQHFYGAFSPIAREIIYMAGPGAVPPDVTLIPYQRMTTGDKYPWVDNPFYPFIHVGEASAGETP